MSDPPSGQSMEDILASIKRIITDEADAAPHAPAIAPPPAPDEDVLELGGPSSREQALVSSPAREASRAALASLATLKIDHGAADNTLDGLVREMLRPMLKEWLDSHLPGLVERVVAREVARLAGG